MNSMRTLIAVAAAGLIALAIGVWSNAASYSTTDPSVSKATVGLPASLVSQVPTLAPAMSVWEIHNQAHLENLPVQEISDQSLVFTAAETRR